MLASIYAEDEIAAYLFNVEKDWVETKEQEGDGGSEPPESLVCLDICVEPSTLRSPLLGSVMIVCRVGCGEEEGVEASDGCQSCNAANSFVEVQCINQVTKHSGIHHARNTGAACYIADGETSSLGEPSGSN